MRRSRPGRTTARSYSSHGGGHSMSTKTRRDFIKQAAMGTAAFLAYPTARVLGANERVRLAMIGVGQRGQELLKQTLGIPSVQVVAVADVYTRRFDEARKISPVLQTVNDYRRILDMKDIDGVLVASPLHIHARHFLETPAPGEGVDFDKKKKQVIFSLRLN